MKTLILASAAVLTLGLGSAFAATDTTTAQQNQQQLAMNTQASGTQNGSAYGQSSNAPANTGYVGGWQAQPFGSNPLASGD